MPGALPPPPSPEAPVPVAYEFAFKEPQPVATGWGHFQRANNTKKDAVHDL